MLCGVTWEGAPRPPLCLKLFTAPPSALVQNGLRDSRSATYSAIIGHRGSAKESHKRADLRAENGDERRKLNPLPARVFMSSADTLSHAGERGLGHAGSPDPGPGLGPRTLPSHPPRSGQPFSLATWSHQLGAGSGLRLTCWVTLGMSLPSLGLGLPLGTKGE